jgi:uncharacterized lipoprotein YddW (UPF0748 family)
MKRIFLLLLIAVFSQTVLHAEQPKREVRSMWLTTAWALDWPAVRVPAPVFAEDGVTIINENARQTARNHQQNQLIGILNRLEAANYNTIYFQVRPMSDAFYKSSFQEEAWSSWISSERGADPGWDPLAFAIEEAHKRGMELHAWLNPYRYSSSAATYGNLDTDYAKTHPEWLMNYGQDRFILNPGIPEVRQRVVDIAADIVTNYNVDGIVFDDYFYMANTTNAMDNAQYAAYPNGFPNTTTGRADWRRNNVNLMVRDVNDRINSIKPWVAWGVSPAGVALGSGSSWTSIAAQYGIRVCPSGSDWQYNQIYSHPVAWLFENTIDYISPQIYWTIGGSNNFKVIGEWWAEISNYFGRHFFASVTSHNGGSTDNTRFSTSEVIRQLRVLRAGDINDTPGAVGFRMNSYIHTTLDAMKEDPYRFPALTAIYGWQQAPIQTLVENLNVSGQDVTWTYTSTDSRTGVRYAIYAIPNANRNDADAFTSPAYLQGVSYTTDFTLADGINSATHKIAVFVYDRFGNLFPPRVFGENTTTIASAVLTYPANNQDIGIYTRTSLPSMLLPTLFTWNDNGADYYVWQVATDAAFTNPVSSRETNAPNFNSALQTNLKPNTTYYWRVLSIKANAPVSVSEVRSFNGTTAITAQTLTITTPANFTETASLTPNFVWTNLGSGATYTLEISTQLTFGDIIYTTTVNTNSAPAMPSGILQPSTTYHTRVKAEFGGRAFISQPHSFSTTFVAPPAMIVPTIISPTDGETIFGTSIEVLWERQRSRGFSLQLSERSNFPPMSTQSTSVTALNFNVVFNNLKAGTYYLRMRALTDDEGQTAWTEIRTIHIAGTSEPEINTLDFCYVYNTSNGNANLVINQSENTSVDVVIYSLTGSLLYRQAHDLNAGTTTIPLELSGYAKGVYLVQVNVGNKTQTLKVTR